MSMNKLVYIASPLSGDIEHNLDLRGRRAGTP